MLRSLYTSRSAMNAYTNKLNIISDNISNSSTIGHKRTECSFKSLLNESLDRKGVPLNDKSSTVGTGIKSVGVYKNYSQGDFKETLKPSDLAIDGDGYFKIVDSSGEELYTRDGSFKIDTEGTLVNSKGDKLFINYKDGFNEENINFKNENIIIDNKGDVFTKENNDFNHVGNIPRYNGIGNDAFELVGDNMFKAKNANNVTETEDNDVYQGLLENSNVDMATEFSEMIITQRAFQLNSKSLTTSDEMWGMINNMRAK